MSSENRTGTRPGRRSRIKCGCGFKASGYDEEQLRAVLAEHEHIVRGGSWASAVFSFEGYLVFTALALVAIAIFGGGS